MRNLAICYSEHAIQVSDSYCSGPLNKSYISPKSIPSTQSQVTFTYKANLCNQRKLFITITWCNKLVCQGFYIKISEKRPKPVKSQHGFHQVNKIQGCKSLLISSSEFPKVDLHWDLSFARFDSVRPVPIGGFYLVVKLVGSKNAFVIGDMDDCNAVGNLVDGLVLHKLTLVSQCELFSGNSNNQINSKAKFNECGAEHEIVIKCGPEDDGPRNPVLSLYIDNKRVVKVKKLQWNFRGNQVIFVDNLLVDVMWDVFGWCVDSENSIKGVLGEVAKEEYRAMSTTYTQPGGCGLFMFRIRSGLDSRLWLEEEERKLVDENHEKPEFSLLICVSSKKSKNPG